MKQTPTHIQDMLNIRQKSIEYEVVIITYRIYKENLIEFLLDLYYY